jgi:MoaA/NifB/PqqE/SkfB family radical SAM enzyme
LTERCDAACAHCWFDCSQDREATMSRYDAQDYIDKASRLQSIEWVSLTGGEPMLQPSLVEGLVAYASGRGLKTELITNCNWATTLEETSGTLRRLRDAGLDVLNISVDDFHQATIPFERVRRCYEAAKGLGIKMVMMTALRKSSQLHLMDVARLLCDDIPSPGEAVCGGNAAIGVESGFAPVGRGALIPREEWCPDTSPLTGSCQTVLRDIGIKPNGEVLPCCSASATLPGFSLGNLDNWNLDELLKKAWESDVFKILIEHGPVRLLGKAPSEVYVNKCHLCSEVLRPILASMA